jgi:thiol-disulfide isomerase/thioredoxin
VRVLLVLLMIASARGPAAAADRCGLSPETAAFVRSLPADREERRERLRQRIDLAPENFELNRLFVDGSVYEWKAERDRYQQLLDGHLDSLDYQYLHARSLVGSNTPQALREYAQILARDPDYPWVHLSQLEIYRADAFRDRKKLEASFAAVTRACPASLEPYRYLNEVADNDAAARGAETLRRLLEAATDPGDLELYGTLWAVESRVRPASERDDQRKRVAEDLKRLLPFEDRERIQRAIAQGAKATGDDALAKRIAARRKPNVDMALMEKSNAWIKAHPRPKPADPPETLRAWGRDLLAESDHWLQESPGAIFCLHERVRALVAMGAPAERIGAAGDAMLARIRGKHSPSVTWLVSLAQTYMDGGVLLDEVHEISAEARKRMSDPEAVIEIDLAPYPPVTARNRQMLNERTAEALLVDAQAYEKQGDRAKAHQFLNLAADYVAAHEPTGDQAEQLRPMYQFTRRYMLKVSAEMAEREGRRLDALSGYREALKANDFEREDLLLRQRRLWKELGGTDEGWQRWIDSLPSPTPAAPRQSRNATPENRKLPPFTLRDTAGGIWTLDRLAGKTTVVTAWATWCEPCRAELPHFAKLAERVKGRDDVLAISFNMDENIAVAEAFAKENGFTFPVLGAKQYAEDLMKVFSIPRTWIIRDGAIVEEVSGITRDDKWVDDIIARLKPAAAK